eukprot:gene16622-18312_t
MATQESSVSESTVDSMLISPRERRTSSSSNGLIEKDYQWRTERSNLLNIGKICIKTLIDSSLKRGRTLNDDFPPLNQFFIVMEHILRHGLKAKRSLLGSRKDYWAVLEAVENKIPSLKDMLLSIRSLPTIKTNPGRGRAWMRLALMQKVLAEQVQSLVDEKDIIKDMYECHAMMRSEESIVISGMLVGLNMIDCNLDLKGENLDFHSGVIDISLYLRDGNYLEKNSVDGADGMEKDVVEDQKLEMILDQKAYLEELNRSLSDSLSQIQNKSVKLQEQNSSLEEKMALLDTKLSEVIEERNRLKEENIKLGEKHQKKLELAQADINTERETYQQSRSGLNEMYLQVKKQFESEAQHSKELQQELQVQIAMNQEKEVAMRLLEKDVHDKQDTLMSLRKQLEDVKKINIDLHSKWQKSVDESKTQSAEWNFAGEENKKLKIELEQAKVALTEAEKTKAESLETLSQMGFKMGDIESERHTLETNLKIEREWRSGMQVELEQERSKLQKMEKEAMQVKILSQENEELRKKIKDLQETCAEQESTLVEMAEKLTRSTLHVDNMKEATAVMKEKVWKDDKLVTNCQQCEQAFSVSRRKHHCRNCGGIFCNNCSDNTMPLPSSAKPVRVCDTCHDKLLARYKAS